MAQHVLSISALQSHVQNVEKYPKIINTNINDDDNNNNNNIIIIWKIVYLELLNF